MNFLGGPQTKRKVIGDAVTLATLCAGEWERDGGGRKLREGGSCWGRGRCRRGSSPLKEVNDLASDF